MKVNFTKKQFSDLWLSGVSNRKIKQVLNISEHIMYECVKALGLPAKKKGRPKKKVEKS